MSGPGTMARGDPQRTACGELALIAAAAAAARLDYEHPEGAEWLAEAGRLAAQMPSGAVVLDVLPLQRLRDRLDRFRLAVEGARQLPTGERDWLSVERAQGELREAVTNALASLYHRAVPVWRQGEAPPWAAPAAAVEDAERVTEGVE